MFYEVERQTNRLLKELEEATPGTEKFTRITKDLSELISIETRLLERNSMNQPWYKQLVSSPAFVGGLFQIGATLLVLNNEKVNVITSKAFSWIRFK